MSTSKFHRILGEHNIQFGMHVKIVGCINSFEDILKVLSIKQQNQFSNMDSLSWTYSWKIIYFRKCIQYIKLFNWPKMSSYLHNKGISTNDGSVCTYAVHLKDYKWWMDGFLGKNIRSLPQGKELEGVVLNVFLSFFFEKKKKFQLNSYEVVCLILLD